MAGIYTTQGQIRIIIGCFFAFQYLIRKLYLSLQEIKTSNNMEKVISFLKWREKFEDLDIDSIGKDFILLEKKSVYLHLRTSFQNRRYGCYYMC